jgi:hypothetical protein
MVHSFNTKERVKKKYKEKNESEQHRPEFVAARKEEKKK